MASTIQLVLPKADLEPARVGDVIDVRRGLDRAVRSTGNRYKDAQSVIATREFGGMNSLARGG